MISQYRNAAPVAYAPVTTQSFPAEYFSGVDCSIFFGDQYIDEITNFEFTLEERIMPVYSYASYTPKRIVHGVRIVTGSFTINMRPGNYLHELLYSTDQPRPSQVPSLTVARINNQIASDQVVLVGYDEPDTTTAPDQWAGWVAEQKQQFWQVVDSLTASKDPRDVLDQLPYFEHQGFTILMVHGDLDINDLSRSAQRLRSIEDIHLFRVGQAIQISGENIMETFHFMASDINTTARAVGTVSRRQASR